MKHTHLAVLAGGLLAATAVGAAEFSWEPSGVANQANTGSSIYSNVDVDHLSLGVTYYFDAVEDSRGPLALAAFFDPATRISAAIDHETTTSEATSANPFFPAPVAKSTTDELSLAGRYVLAESKWYFGGRYTRGDVDPAPGFRSIDGDTEGYGALVGKYLGADTTLELGFDASNVDGMLDNPGCAFPPCGVFTTETDRDEWSVAAQHVWHGRPVAYSLWARVAETKGVAKLHSPPITISTPSGPVVVVPAGTTEFDIPRMNQYSVAGEIFPTQKLGVRLGYARWDGPINLHGAYDVSATWFVTHNIGVSLAFSEQRYPDSAFDDGDTTAVRIVGRF